jgi:hypothetical protein
MSSKKKSGRTAQEERSSSSTSKNDPGVRFKEMLARAVSEGSKEWGQYGIRAPYVHEWNQAVEQEKRSPLLKFKSTLGKPMQSTLPQL